MNHQVIRDAFGQLSGLREAIRQRAPQVTADCAESPLTRADRPAAEPECYLRIRVGAEVTWRVVWHDRLEEFVWDIHPIGAPELGGEVDTAAEGVLRALRTLSGAPLHYNSPFCDCRDD
jgi:hypothetical protein